MNRLRIFLRFARRRIDWVAVSTFAFILLYVGMLIYAIATRNELIGQIAFAVGMGTSALILVAMFVRTSVKWSRGFMDDFKTYERQVNRDKG